MADGSTATNSRFLSQALIRVGPYQEEVDLDVIEIQKYDVILGRPWLDHLNPEINWKEKTLKFQWKEFQVQVPQVQDGKGKVENCSTEEIQGERERISSHSKKKELTMQVLSPKKFKKELKDLRGSTVPCLVHRRKSFQGTGRQCSGGAKRKERAMGESRNRS